MMFGASGLIGPRNGSLSLNFFFFPQAKLHKGKDLENGLWGQINLTSNSDPIIPNSVTLGLSFLINKTKHNS